MPSEFVSVQARLSTALELHCAGQLQLAAEAYQQILADEHANADALHLLGVLRHQQGLHAEAVELIGRAVALQPNAVEYHVNLAEAYRARGEFERAAGCCRVALQLRPNSPEALGNLGLALQGLKQHAEAAGYLQQAIELQPASAGHHNNLGISLRELKKNTEAMSHFRTAVEIAPDFAFARTNLGQLLLDCGQPEEALPHCQAAVQLQPDLAAVHHNLGNVLRNLQRFAEARSAYLEALRLAPRQAISHAQLGLLLQAEQQPGNALVWLKNAVDLEPENVRFWEHLADHHTEQEAHDEAVACWQRIVSLEPSRADAHNLLGYALKEEKRLTEAGEHFRTAIRLQPDLVAAHINLSDLHQELGAFSEAEAAIRGALRLRPAYALAHARLATTLRGKLPETDLAVLLERLSDPHLGEQPRARLLFAAAQVWDARGEYPRAAECLREANALNRVHAASEKRDYDPADHDRFTEGLIRGFGREWFSRMSGADFKAPQFETKRPIFVFGLPRSGTTLIEQILASHPRVYGAGELPLGQRSFASMPAVAACSAPPLHCLAEISPDAIRNIAERHHAQLLALAPDTAERVVDKMPDNYMYLGFLATLFPQAVFISCRRDLRDVAVSCWMTDFKSIRWSNDPSHIGARFSNYCRLMEHWRRVLPVPIHEVDYEETVSDVERVARRLVDACGLEWHPACLDFHRTERPVRTASVLQVREPIYTRSVARWRNYASTMAELFAALPAAGAARSSSRDLIDT